MKSLNIFRNPFRIIVIISLFFVGCVSDIAIALETVKVGFSPVVATGPLFLGIERGYFNEAGIKNELVEFRTSGLRLQALMAGDLDVSTSGFGADIIITRFKCKIGKLKFSRIRRRFTHFFTIIVNEYLSRRCRKP